ncbi:MAG: Hsp20/alpha crystallin family protein [Pseudomonas sp.]|uniref:Hsp20/alpha crystallin family protein n=1 Tax=Pseudomonas sp. TaxID=306 RepID=UPI0033969766
MSEKSGNADNLGTSGSQAQHQGTPSGTGSPELQGADQSSGGQQEQGRAGLQGGQGMQSGQREQGLRSDQQGQHRHAMNRTERRTRENSLSLMPWVDVFENEDSILLLADLPGVSKEKLELRIENDLLQIEGEISTETPEQIEAIYAEVRAPRYSRTFSLSSELDTGNIDAQLHHGVLQLRIPKHAHAQPRRIEIKVV